MNERRIPDTLEEAYRLRDEAVSLTERDFYQEHVYRLRREEYRSRGIRTEISSRRRPPPRGAPPPPPTPPRHPRLSQAARLATLGGRGALQAQLPRASEDGEVTRRSLLPLADHRARQGRGVPARPREREGDGLPNQGPAGLHRREGRDPDPGPPRRDDPDPAHLLRLALRLCVGDQDVGSAGERGHDLPGLFGPRRGRRSDAYLRGLYNYLYQVHKQVAPTRGDLRPFRAFRAPAIA